MMNVASKSTIECRSHWQGTDWGHVNVMMKEFLRLFCWKKEDGRFLAKCWNGTAAAEPFVRIE